MTHIDRGQQNVLALVCAVLLVWFGWKWLTLPDVVSPADEPAPEEIEEPPVGPVPPADPRAVG